MFGVSVLILAAFWRSGTLMLGESEGHRAVAKLLVAK